MLNYRPTHDWIQIEETECISPWLVQGVSISLKTDVVTLGYFKHWLFDLAEFIVKTFQSSTPSGYKDIRIKQFVNQVSNQFLYSQMFPSLTLTYLVLIPVWACSPCPIILSSLLISVPRITFPFLTITCFLTE